MANALDVVNLATKHVIVPRVDVVVVVADILVAVVAHLRTKIGQHHAAMMIVEHLVMSEVLLLKTVLADHLVVLLEVVLEVRLQKGEDLDGHHK